MKQQTFKTQIATRIECMADKIVGHKDGTVSVMRGYFYRHGQTSEKWAQNVMAEIGDFASLVEHRDEWRAWPKDSYFVAVVRQQQEK